MSDRDYPASNQRVHELKVWPAYFAALADGRKTFEIRRNDRGYQVGDVLALREWRPDLVPGSGDYTGRSLTRVVTYITDFEQMQGIVVMGLAGVAPPQPFSTPSRWEASTLPPITPEIQTMFGDEYCLIDSDGMWSQVAVDFACLLKRHAVETAEGPKP